MERSPPPVHAHRRHYCRADAAGATQYRRYLLGVGLRGHPRRRARRRIVARLRDQCWLQSDTFDHRRCHTGGCRPNQGLYLDANRFRHLWCRRLRDRSNLGQLRPDLRQCGPGITVLNHPAALYRRTADARERGGSAVCQQDLDARRAEQYPTTVGFPGLRYLRHVTAHRGHRARSLVRRDRVRHPDNRPGRQGVAGQGTGK